MREFDYKRAWEEVAWPAFQALPQNVRDLYERVCVEMEDRHQNEKLGLDWPDSDSTTKSSLSSLRTAFSEIPAEVLLDAAETVYYYGHWGSKQEAVKGGGGTWKFQILARQSLIERGYVPKGRGGDWPAADWSTPRYSKEVIDKYMVETDPKVIERDERRGRAVARLREIIVAPYIVEKIETITLPHPFCITDRHIGSADGILDERAMRKHPCGICKGSYDEHEQRETVIVRVPNRIMNVIPEDLKEMLVAATEVMKEEKIEGFAFPGPGQEA